MPGPTTETRQAIYNLLFRNTPMTPWPALYLGLFYKVGGVATEIPASGYGYTRHLITATAPDAFGAGASDGITRIGPAIADWPGEVTDWGLFVAATGGTVKYLDPLPFPQIVRSNGYFELGAGDLELKITEITGG